MLSLGLIPAHAGKTSQAGDGHPRHPAHPRACGENSGVFSAVVTAVGSSPRMRGKRVQGLDSCALERLIPAHAGKTTALQMRFPVHWAHPRACGENASTKTRAIFKMGSSPRMRGKLQVAWDFQPLCGLIPAHAGKTHSLSRIVSLTAAHPRACGENCVCHVGDNADRGSSPRMRGKPPLRPGNLKLRRLIPAHAGKTDSVLFRPRRSTAHPRACGENKIEGAALFVASGSSPRMRGKPVVSLSSPNHIRLIPAHAGKTSCGFRGYRRARAHPRACGENKQRKSPGTSTKGSSPRMRGKPVSKILQRFQIGLIPAHAGKTRNGSRPRNSQSAHPRACGENPKEAQWIEAQEGSSPRMRGKHQRPHRRHQIDGLIPAHAGKTP